MLDGILEPTTDREVTWRDGRTHVELEPGGRARFVAAPRVVGVPDDVRSAGADRAADAPEALRRLRPAGAILVRSDDAWWVVSDPGDGT